MEDLDVEGRIILKLTFKKIGCGVDCTDVSEGTDKWDAVMNTVMKFGVPFLTTRGTVSFSRRNHGVSYYFGFVYDLVSKM